MKSTIILATFTTSLVLAKPDVKPDVKPDAVDGAVPDTAYYVTVVGRGEPPSEHGGGEWGWRLGSELGHEDRDVAAVPDTVKHVTVVGRGEPPSEYGGGEWGWRFGPGGGHGDRHGRHGRPIATTMTTSITVQYSSSATKSAPVSSASNTTASSTITSTITSATTSTTTSSESSTAESTSTTFSTAESSTTTTESAGSSTISSSDESTTEGNTSSTTESNTSSTTESNTEDATTPTSTGGDVVTSQIASTITTVPDKTASETPDFAFSTRLSSGKKVTISSNYKQALLDSHNLHRDNSSVPHLEWDDELADLSNQIAQNCIYQHNNSVGDGQYGQNIGAGAPPKDVPKLFTNLMYNGEIDIYPGYGIEPDMTRFHEWGHFSQMIWKETEKVGCATFHCVDGLANVSKNTAPYFTVCNYRPPGNVGPLYAKNVLKPGGMDTITI